MNDENTEQPENEVPEINETVKVQKKRGPGRPRKNPASATTPRRRGRPPKSASTAGSRRGRQPKAMSLMMEFEREIESRFQGMLEKAEQQIAVLKADLKAAQNREKAALKLFDKQQKALSRFVTTWTTKELAKVQKATEPKKRRGRPRKNS